MLTNFMEKNRVRGQVKYTARVKLNGIKMTLKNNWRRNKFKMGYEISCGFGVKITAVTGIQRNVTCDRVLEGQRLWK